MERMHEYGDGVVWNRGKLLGRGSFGSVYMGVLKPSKLRCRYLPVLMAVKSAEISVSESLQKEGEILRNIKNCSNIIQLYGEETTMGENGTIAYNLLLEYGSGGTLDNWIKNQRLKKLSEFEAKKHTRSILKGLLHVHEMGYVHCDLKPDNVLMVSKPSKGSFEYVAKLGDFGLAKHAMHKELGSYWRGTPMYLSPEAVQMGIQEPPSDIWALGCVVLEMLTGKSAWDKDNELGVTEILGKIGHKQECPVIPRKVSKNARSFLRACFVRDPWYRWTARMLLQHPFVEGLVDDEDDDDDYEAEELEVCDSNELRCGSVSDDHQEKAVECGYTWRLEVEPVECVDELQGISYQGQRRIKRMRFVKVLMS